MSDRPHVFGYGSLVNRRTHGHAPAGSARLRGWRRAWRATDLRRVAYLSAIPARDGLIEGLVAEVRPEDRAALDMREAAYGQVAAKDVVHGLGVGIAVTLYVVDPRRSRPPGPDNPVLLSYLDTVVQGYLTEFGLDGVDRFFATTDGWEATVLDDRAATLYPRATASDDGGHALVDRHLDALHVRRITE